jgi:hypothetical protein
MSRRWSWLYDPSLWLLLAANVWPIWLVWQGELTPIEVYWGYFAQTVLMLLLSTVRLLLSGYGRKGTGSLLGMSVEHQTILGYTKTENDYSAAWLFFSTGFMALAIYLPFIAVLVGLPNWPALVPVATGFSVAHVWSVVQHKAAIDPKHIGPQFLWRILPMHLSIVLGAATGALFGLAFMALKTVIDAVGHVTDHLATRPGE